MLSGEVISGVFYPSIANSKVIVAALSYKKRKQGDWARGGTSVYKPKINLNTADGRFDARWEEWNREHPNE